MTSLPLSIGIGPPPEFPDLPVQTRRDYLSRAADGGIDHVFVADHVSFYGGIGMDGLIQAAALAMLEPRLDIVVGVYLLALRHPVVAARQVATVAQWAPGRLVLGVGVGGEDRHEFEVCDVDPSTRGRRTDDALDIVARLLAGECVSHHGEFFSFDDAVIRPVPDPAVPIIVGGRSTAALRRAAAAAGWLGVWVSPERLAREIEVLGPGRHGLQVWVGVDDDRSRAQERLARAMEGFYRVPFSKFERYSPWGRAEEVGEALLPYVEAGARIFNLQIVAPGPEAALDAGAVISGILHSGSVQP